MTAEQDDNVWRHLDVDDGLHAVGRDDDGNVLVDGRRFTLAQAREFATSILMHATETVVDIGTDPDLEPDSDRPRSPALAVVR